MIEILLAEKVTFYMILLITITLLFSGELPLEIFFILTYLALLFLREVTSHFSSKKVKVRMNVFIVGGLILFAWIMWERVVEIITSV